MDRKTVVEKIKKCLALSASSNEHEAAAALRQAHKLMELHGITDLDVEAAQAEERRTRSGAARQPVNWEACLAEKIGTAFGCKVFFSSSGWRDGRIKHHGEWCFVGCGASPEVAQYAFAALLRQAKKAREVYIKTKLKRCKVATKTRRADLFCAAWVYSVAGKITAFAGNEQQARSIDAFLTARYPDMGSLDAKSRSQPENLSGQDISDLFEGARQGRAAQLHRGVNGAGQDGPLCLESLP